MDGVKKVTRLVPFLLAQIPFWGIYSQMSTAFQNQVRFTILPWVQFVMLDGLFLSGMSDEFKFVWSTDTCFRFVFVSNMCHRIVNQLTALNLFDTLAIVLLVPVFDRVLYPRLKSHNINFTMLRKIGSFVRTRFFLDTICSCQVLVLAVQYSACSLQQL